MLTRSDYNMNKECRLVNEIGRRICASQLVIHNKERGRPDTIALTEYIDALEEDKERCCNTIREGNVISKIERRQIRRRLKEWGDTTASFYSAHGFTKERWKAPEGLVKTWLEETQKRAMKAHTQNMKERLRLALADADKKGKYLVFNTLTVAPEYEDQIFEKGSTKWKEYIRQITRDAGKTEGLDKKTADKDKDLHQYFGVVENGGKNGRLHIHAIHILRTLPPGSKDPNSIIPGHPPIRRIIDSMRRYWQYGFSMPLAIRYGWDDAFSRAGWRWPVEKGHDGLTRPMRHGTMGKIVGYISKYITKSEGEKHRWRTRMTQKLGTSLILEILKTLPVKTLARTLMFRTAKMPEHMPSWSLVRKSVMNLLMKRGYSAKSFPDLPAATPITQPGALIERICQMMELECQSTGSISRHRRHLMAVTFELQKNLPQQKGYNHNGAV